MVVYEPQSITEATAIEPRPPQPDGKLEKTIPLPDPYHNITKKAALRKIRTRSRQKAKEAREEALTRLKSAVQETEKVEKTQSEQHQLAKPKEKQHNSGDHVKHRKKRSHDKDKKKNKKAAGHSTSKTATIPQLAGTQTLSWESLDAGEPQKAKKSKRKVHHKEKKPAVPSSTEQKKEDGSSEDDNDMLMVTAEDKGISDSTESVDQKQTPGSQEHLATDL
ncbi:hypothetical protein COOONC_05915 [Cooperia oncophora]